jgi:hypothetical protein
MNYAIIENETVINIIVAENEEIAQNISGSNEIVLLENESFGIGWTRVDGVWIDPRVILEAEIDLESEGTSETSEDVDS